MHRFPFGQPIRAVTQIDKTPKKVFLLGVYASAVHAQWIGVDGRVRIRALGVASEPEIFWTGDGADEIVAKISLLPGIGRLQAADRRFNGPSGRALNKSYLTPLKIGRTAAWLCDLLPESRCNPSQAAALVREYEPLRELLPDYSWPSVPKRFADKERINSIAEELVASKAETLITLGDIPLREFAAAFGAKSSLSEYGTSEDGYGRPIPMRVAGHHCELMPLVHPRQADGLGRSSFRWRELHQAWVRRHCN